MGVALCVYGRTPEYVQDYDKWGCLTIPIAFYNEKQKKQFFLPKTKTY